MCVLLIFIYIVITHRMARYLLFIVLNRQIERAYTAYFNVRNVAQYTTLFWPLVENRMDAIDIGD